MRFLTYAMAALLGASTTAYALKWSDRSKAQDAITAIAMANALASYTAGAINCHVSLVNAPGGTTVPEVILTSGTAYTNLLAAITTKINSDKATAESYLSAQGVTND